MNAIGQRLERLHDQWVAFSIAPEPRILVWQVRQDEYRMIETFLQKESDDAAGELPDVFLRYNAPFNDVDQYGAALLEELVAQYDVVREELTQDGIDAPWTLTAVPAGTHSLIAFTTAAASLQASHGDEMDTLALVLTPSDVSDPAQWQRWLIAAARHLPPTVRILVIDDIAALQLGTINVDGGDLVSCVPVDLDMPGAIVALAQGAAGSAGSGAGAATGAVKPDVQFRIEFATLGQALGTGDLKAADEAALRALQITQQQNWTHLSAAVHFAMGAGMLNAGRTAEAIERYQQVDTAGAAVQAEDDALGKRLRMQAAFASGAAYVSAAMWADGARVYQAAAALAEQLNEPVMVIDAWRMASYCYEQLGHIEYAWECGHRALNASLPMEPDQRGMSMLPHAGEALLRIAGSSRPHVDAVNNRMAELLGTAEWRPEQAVPA